MFFPNVLQKCVNFRLKYDDISNGSRGSVKMFSCCFSKYVI